MKQTVEKLTKLASDDEKLDLTMYYNARQRCRVAYNEDSSAARKKDLDAAQDGLQKIIAELEQKYTSPATRTAAPGIADPLDVLFKNSTEMYEELKAKGWGISSRQTLTNHAKNGSLQLSPDRSITASAFELWKNNPAGGQKYYEAFVRNKRDAYGTIEDNALKKSAEELKAIEFKNRKAEREEQQELGKLITRTDADVEICAWAALTRDAIASRISQILPSIIHTTGGQLAALPEAQNLLDTAIDQACNDIANSDEVDVQIEPVETLHATSDCGAQ